MFVAWRLRRLDGFSTVAISVPAAGLAIFLESVETYVYDYEKYKYDNGRVPEE